MLLNKLKIKGLFDVFDYDLDFKNEEKISIITGPNGFGKTMILNILFSLFNQRFSFFYKLAFHQIEVILDNNFKIILDKEEEKTVSINFLKDNKEFDGCLYRIFSEKQEKALVLQIEDFLPFLQKIGDDQWIDRRFGDGKILSFDEIIQENTNNLQKEFIQLVQPKLKEESWNILKSFKAHLIKEQRLLKLDTRPSFNEDKAALMNVVKECSKNLKSLIENKQKEYSKISQKLDSSFPKRLFESSQDLTEEEFKIKSNQIKEKQKLLKEYGLSDTEQSVFEINKTDKNNFKILSVYLEDSSKKLSVFDDLLNKIKLFADILNKKRLSFKYIEIDAEKGFICKNEKGKILSLEDLSSGEQHEIILLYELIFKTEENTLLLIDEPEISLHVAWQQEFIEDLKEIMKLNNIQIIVATHSPGIINSHWNLVVDLFEESKK